jgi:hypothetical protein
MNTDNCLEKMSGSTVVAWAGQNTLTHPPKTE